MSSKKNKVVLEARDSSPNREKLYKRFKKLNGPYGPGVEIGTRSQKNLFLEKQVTGLSKKHRSSNNSRNE